MDEVAKTLEGDLPQVDLTKPVKVKKNRPPVNKEPPAYDEFKLQMESLLFASARRVPASEIAELCNVSLDDVKRAFTELRDDYNARNTAIMLIDEDEGYKFTVREKFIPIIQNVVVETELSKTVLETLAVIAYKQPCIQSEVIRIRTNKAYDHLHELEQLGYIVREPYGRTKKIKLTSKFFEYFDLPKSKLKEAFGAFEAVEKAISEREDENQKLKEEIQKQEDAAKKDAEKAKEDQEKELENIGDLETFEESVHKEMKDAGEHLGTLEVYESEDEPEKPKKKSRKAKAADQDQDENTEEAEEPEDESGDETAEESGEESDESNDESKDADSEGVESLVDKEDTEDQEEPEEDKPKEQEEQAPPEPKPTEESYQEFLEGQKEEDIKHAEFKKAKGPLITGSEDMINERVDAIMHPHEEGDESKSPALSAISSEDKEKSSKQDQEQEQEAVPLLDAARNEKVPPKENAEQKEK